MRRVLVVETRLILLEDLQDLLLFLDAPVSRWVFSEPDLCQIILLVHLRSGTRSFYHLLAVNTSLALSLQAWMSDASFPTPNVCDQNVSFPNPSSPRTGRIQGIFRARLSSRTGGLWTSLWQK